MPDMPIPRPPLPDREDLLQRVATLEKRLADRGRALAAIRRDRDLWKERSRTWEHRSKDNLRILQHLINREKG